jgi:hypothetical protein
MDIKGIEERLANFEPIFEYWLDSETAAPVKSVISNFAMKWGIDIDYLVGLAIGSLPEYCQTCEEYGLSQGYFNGANLGEENKINFSIYTSYVEEYLATHFIDSMKKEKDPKRVVQAILIENALYSGINSIFDLEKIQAWRFNGSLYAMDKSVAEKRGIKNIEQVTQTVKKDITAYPGSWVMIEDLNINKKIYLNVSEENLDHSYTSFLKHNLNPAANIKDLPLAN